MKIDSNSLSTSEFNKMAWNENGFENKLNDSKAGNNCAFLLDCHSTQNDKVSAYEGDGCKPKINFTAVNCMTPSAVALSKKAIKSTFILKDTRSHHLGRKSVVKQNGTVEISRNTSPKKKQSTQEVELIGDSVNTMNNKCNDKNKDISLKLNTFHVLDDNQVKNLIHVNGVEVVDKLSIENVNNTPKQVPVQLNKTSVKQINPKKDSTSYRSDNNTSINIDRKIKIDDNKHIKKDATLRPNSLVLPNPSKAVDFLLPNKCIQPSESKAESVDHGMKLKNKKRGGKTLSASWKPIMPHNEEKDKQPLNRKERIDSMHEKGYGRISSYRTYEKLGEGTYATVYKGYSLLSKQPVALKRIRMRKSEGAPCTAIREISLLRGLNHANIIKLHDVIYEAESLTLVFEFGGKDLRSYMRLRNNHLSMNLVRLFTFQIFRGLEYCHARQILHRDLKPQNLLINQNGDLKLADFGLARSQSVPIKTYSSEVVTLWYRPPDVLLGDKNYSGHIDIWGVGCILYEMTTGYSLFPGTSKEDQVKIIFKKFGIPPDSYWPGLRNNSKFIEYFSPHQKDHPKASNFSKSSSDLRESNEKVIVLKQNKVDETSSMTVDEYNSHIMKKLSSCASRLNPEGLDLLFSCLALVGFRRITAFNALKHAYFQDILPSSINVHDLLPEQSIAFLAGEHIKSKFRSQFEYSRVKKDSITLSSAAAYGNKLNGYETLSKSLTNLNTNVPHLSNESKVSNSLAYIRQSVDQTSSKDSQPFQPIQSKEPQKSRQRRHHLYHTKRNANTTTQKNDSPKSCSLSDIDYSLSVCSDYDLVFHRNVKQRQPPPPHTTTSSSTTPPTTTTISLTSINKEVDLDKQTKLSNRKFRSISSVLGSKLLSYHRSSSSISSSGCSNSISSTASIRNQTTKSLKTSLKHKLSSFQSKTKGLRNRIKSSSHNQLIIERPSSAVPIITKSSQQTNLSYSGDVKSQNVNINSTRLHVDDDVITHGVEKNVTISKTCDIKSDQKYLPTQDSLDNCHKYPIESIKSINETSVHTTKPVHITYSPSYQQGDKINSEYTNNLLNNSSISINHCKDNQLNNQSSSSSEFINQPIRINNLNSKSGHPTHNFVSNILQHTNNCRKSWNSSGSSNLDTPFDEQSVSK